MGTEAMDLATCYLAQSTALRDALSIPREAPLDPVPLGQGEHNANFTFTHPETHTSLVLRINYVSQLGLENQIEYEASALRTLGPSGRTPKLLFVDGSKRIIDNGVLVMEKREGAHLDFERDGDTAEAARILADIHAIDPDAVPDCPLLDPGDALLDLYEEDKALFAEYCASPLADTALAQRIEGFFAAVESLTTQRPAGERHILNTEAVPSHFLIPEDGSPGSMVDWEKPIIGEVARDIAYFTAPTTTIWDTEFIFDAAARARFVEQYWEAVDGRFPRGAFDERFDAYLQMNCLRGVSWSALAWTEYQDPSRPLKNEKTSAKLPIYQDKDFLDMLARDVFHIA